MKKLLIAVAFLTGCLSEAPAPSDNTPTTDDQAMSSTSQDIMSLAPPGFDMEAWLQKINPRTCGSPPSCQLLISPPNAECRDQPNGCGDTCIRVPGSSQKFIGVCGTPER